MQEFVASGRAIDLVLLVLAVELLLLLASKRVADAGIRRLDVLGQLLAGACLLVALRCALSGADYRWTLVFVTASLPAHMFDLARRLRARGGATSKPIGA